MIRSLPLVALALAVAVVIVDARIVVGGSTWDDLAYHTVIAPPRFAAARAVTRGELPGWWDGAGFGVPLWGFESSHGAATPAIWLATGPRALDLILVLHVLWLAFGVALWARRAGASDLGAIVGGVLVATTGVVASAAVRGALPALAHLPWIGWAATALASASTAPARARSAALVGVFVAAIALAGQLGLVIDAALLAVLVGARRGTTGMLVLAIAAGLAIGALVWIPALLVHGAGARVAGIPPGRFLELLVPGSFGSSASDRAVTSIAGVAGWAPSLYLGAPLVALAAIPRPDRRIAIAMIALGVLALVVDRGGWPAWLGAPELHVGALAAIAAVSAAHGLDAFVAGERRARIVMIGGIGITMLALAGVVGVAINARSIETIVFETGVGLACVIGAVLLFRSSTHVPRGCCRWCSR